MADGETNRFPEGFLWGAATAAYQVEGAVAADGRGPSIWDEFCRRPGAVYNGDTGDVACDHYHRADEDLDLMARLGLSSYRFSVAWPRVQPDGRGPANQAGLDFYRRLVDGLRDRGIVPALTLYHWDLPQALDDAGGWTSRDTADRFAEYAGVVADALGDRVGLWITLNEPFCSAWIGYAHGHHAPGHRSIDEALSATHHLLLGHGRAVAALRAAGAGPVGVTLVVPPVSAASDHPDDQAPPRPVDGNANRLFLDPIFRGAYPDDMRAHYERRQPGWAVVADGDLDEIRAPLDFLGVNYYEPYVVAAPDRLDAARASGRLVRTPRPGGAPDDLHAVHVGDPDAARTAMGWEVHPWGLTETLVRIHRDYTQIPLYVTENGAAYPDYVGPNGTVGDPERVRYLRGHIAAVGDAIDRGVDVRGYFAWTLLDNFEWAYGYSKRFGLVYVDYPTGRRIPKASFDWYRRVIQANGLIPQSE